MKNFLRRLLWTFTRTPEKAPTREDVIQGYRLFLGREPESDQTIDRHVAHHRTIWGLIQSLASSKEAIERKSAPKSYDVVEAYRQFLGREPEHDEAIRHHIDHHPNIWTLINAVQNSTEGSRFRVWRATNELSKFENKIDVSSSVDEIEMMLSHINNVWTRYGTEDPHFSVLSHPRFRAGQITSNQIDEFYASGRRPLAFLMSVFERNTIKFPYNSAICELGCGLGRVAEHFVDLCSSYTGVDISQTHLVQARDRVTSTKAKFVHLTDYLEADEKFNFFFSLMTLQHNPPPIMEYLLDRFFSRLNPGGYAFFQVPTHIYEYSFDSRSYLSGNQKLEHMEMHALPQHRIFSLFEKQCLRIIEVIPDGHIGKAGHSYAFFAQKI